MLVEPVLCDGVAVMSSRLSCSHVYTVLLTCPHGVVFVLALTRFVPPLMAYGHPFTVPVYSTIVVELYWLLITCKDPLILTT